MNPSWQVLPIRSRRLCQLPKLAANHALKLELASDSNRLATAQAKIGARVPALANHSRAVEMSRQLQRENPTNVELRVALGLALAGRADAFARFARTGRTGSSRAADLEAAERDYAESVETFTALERAGSIQGTDLQTLENNRSDLVVVWRAIGRTK